VTRLDALGDIVLGTMLLSGLRARWPGALIRLIVRPPLAGAGALLPEGIEVAPLPFDPRDPIAGREQQLAQELRAFAAQNPAHVFILGEYNRVWAGELLAQICGATQVLSFNGPTGLNLSHQPIRQLLAAEAAPDWQTVHVESEEREPAKYAKFLDALGLEGGTFQPAITVSQEDRAQAAARWADIPPAPEQTIVCFPSSGEKLARSLDAGIWARWIAHLRNRAPVVLLGGEADADVLQAIADHGLAGDVPRIIMPAARPGLLGGFLQQARAYIGMDTGPMHVSAVLGRPTLGIFGGGHGAHRFLPVGSAVAAIRMPLGCYGCDWFCPFDRRLCIKRIPEGAIFAAGDAFLDHPPTNADIFSPHIFEIQPPIDLPVETLGATMRQHRNFLRLNHEVTEHHAYLADIIADQRKRLEDLSTVLKDLSGTATLAEMSRQNLARDEAIRHAQEVLSEMSAQNAARDTGIGSAKCVLAEMTLQNQAKDAAIAHLNSVIAEMSRLNLARDEAIAQLTQQSKRKWKLWYS
ncbi:MAG TPA: glycosyltransferase family 9 protein, partial [Tepidisphaeraceae bacterium]|nr:glycosyltransferase family 9 protein [Tepidisphaeraceae bacterium]